MMMRAISVFALVLACMAAAWAQNPAARPAATQPEPAATQVDPRVEEILDRQEAATGKFDSLTATLKYFSVQPARKSTVTRDGRVAVLRKRGADGRPDESFFWVHFKNRITDLFESDKSEDFALYKGWLIEISEAGRTVTRRQVVPPGKVVNIFRIGEGPFPLPIWQTKKDVLANFDVRLGEPGKGDPANTDRLDLTPKPNTELASKQKSVSIFISRESSLPVRVVAVSPKNDERVTVDLSDIVTNPRLNEEDFNLKTPAGYQESSIPLDKT